MVQPVRASFRDILLAIQAQLALQDVQDISHILIAAGDTEVPHYQGDQDIVIRSMNESPDQSVINAAGRIDNRRNRRVTVTMRTRLLLDQADQDVNRLTDPALGHIALEDATCDALELFIPLDSVGNSLVAYPITVGGLTTARHDPKAREWIESSFDLDVPYSRALTQDILTGSGSQ